MIIKCKYILIPILIFFLPACGPREENNKAIMNKTMKMVQSRLQGNWLRNDGKFNLAIIISSHDSGKIFLGSDIGFMMDFYYRIDSLEPMSNGNPTWILRVNEAKYKPFSFYITKLTDDTLVYRDYLIKSEGIYLKSGTK
jgi:hypothetical protein